MRIYMAGTGNWLYNVVIRANLFPPLENHWKTGTSQLFMLEILQLEKYISSVKFMLVSEI